MGHAITAYVVDNVVADIRAKRTISAGLCEEIYDATYHDRMRAELAHDDFNALRTLCESREAAVQTLGISMLRQLVQHEDAGRLAAAQGQDGEVEVAHKGRPDHRPDRGPTRGQEQ